jgi:rhamnosyltransferase
VIDNGSSNHIQNWKLDELSENIEIQYIRKNLGISAAQNIGIKIAKKYQNIKYILLSDQDSKPAEDMVIQLRKTIDLLIKDGFRIAAIGPCFTDTRQNNPPPFIKIEGLRLKRQLKPQKYGYVEVDYLIASGCLIPIDTLAHVGDMKEEMFIDYVDIEWGLRAKSEGYQSFGDFNAKMTHSLGDSPIVFRGKSYPLHSPVRHYYLARNAVWLYKQKYIPLKWKVVDGYKLILKFGFYSLFAKPRKKHFLMMLKGIIHGAISRMGPAS